MNISLYNDVFDSFGNIKPCGRDKCIALISACNKYCGNTICGNEDSGIMNVEAIKNLQRGGAFNDGE